MFLTHFGNENFSLSRIWILNGESYGIEIRIISDEYINMTLKIKITTLKNLIEMKQMILNDPKFDIKKPLDTLKMNFLFFNMTSQIGKFIGLPKRYK